MPFADRIDAGKQLARALAGYRNRRPAVLALPRGGVPVAAEIAEALHAPLELILVRKLGVPGQPELAMGAIADGEPPVVVLNDRVLNEVDMEQRELDAVYRRELAEIERRKSTYLGGRRPLDLSGCTAIVVDDGIATGSTMRAALGAVRNRKPKSIVLAVPVAPVETVRKMRTEVDDVVCLEEYDEFRAIGLCYENFAQLSDTDVIAILARFPSHAAT